MRARGAELRARSFGRAGIIGAAGAIWMSALLLLVSGGGCHWPDRSPNRVTYVFDGDTVKLADGGRVRLVGIDAPELGGRGRPTQPYGRKSQFYLNDLVVGQTIDIRRLGVDRYGRILGEIFLEGRNINLMMVEAGMAEVYRGRMEPGLDADMYRRAEESARRDRRGIWSLGDRYISPRQWRRMGR